MRKLLEPKMTISNLKIIYSSRIFKYVIYVLIGICCYLFLYNSLNDIIQEKNVNNKTAFNVIMFLGYVLCMALIFYYKRNDRISLGKAISFIVLAFIVVQVVSVGIFSKISTKYVIINFSSNVEEEIIPPGETREYNMPEHKCSLDSILIDSGMNSQYQIDLKILQEEHKIIITNIGDDNFLTTKLKDSQTLNIYAVKYSDLAMYMTLVILFVLAVYIIYIINYCKNSLADIEHFLLISLVVMSCIFIVLFAPWNTPDASTHYSAAYRFSNILLGYSGQMEWYGRTEDAVFFKKLWNYDLNPSVKSYLYLVENFHVFSQDNTMIKMPNDVEWIDVYSIVNYIPQVIGLTIGRLLNLSAVCCVYLARLITCLCYIALCYNAVKVTPIAKSLFAAISLMPICIMFGSAFSYDMLVIGVSLNFIASVFAVYEQGDSNRKLLRLCIFACLLGIIKGGACILLLIILFVLFDKKDRKCTIKNVCIPLCAGVFSMLVFNVIPIAVKGEMFQFGVDGSEKLSAMYAFKYPLEYVQMVILTYIKKIDDIAGAMIGGTHLAWLEATLPYTLLTVYMFVMCIHSVYEKDRINMTKKGVNICMIPFCLMLIVAPIMLLSSTPVGNSTVDGLQGRYYIQVLILPLIVLFKWRLKITDENVLESPRAVGIRNWCLKISAIILCLVVFYMLSMYMTRWYAW